MPGKCGWQVLLAGAGQEPGKCRWQAPGKCGWQAPGKCGWQAPGKCGWQAPGKCGWQVPGKCRWQAMGVCGGAGGAGAKCGPILIWDRSLGTAKNRAADADAG